MTQFSVEAINRAVNGTLEGDPAIAITGVAGITEARPGQITFVGAKKYVPLWAESGASAAVVNRDLDIGPGPERALVRVADKEGTTLKEAALELGYLTEQEFDDTVRADRMAKPHG